MYFIVSGAKGTHRCQSGLWSPGWEELCYGTWNLAWLHVLQQNPKVHMNFSTGDFGWGVHPRFTWFFGRKILTQRFLVWCFLSDVFFIFPNLLGDTLYPILWMYQEATFSPQNSVDREQSLWWILNREHLVSGAPQSTGCARWLLPWEAQPVLLWHACPLWAVCVCVCVCEWVREREREITTSPTSRDT